MVPAFLLFLLQYYLLERHGRGVYPLVFELLLARPELAHDVAAGPRALHHVLVDD